jgi:hypothetical protein
MAGTSFTARSATRAFCFAAGLKRSDTSRQAPNATDHLSAWSLGCLGRHNGNLDYEPQEDLIAGRIPRGGDPIPSLDAHIAASDIDERASRARVPPPFQRPTPA